MEKFLGETIPKLGFGFMRIPTLDEGAVDIEQTKEMVDLFLSQGFCYFDTAYGYMNGESEKAIKTALVDRYPREKYILATKLPAWAGPKTKEEAQQMFYTSLERTGAGYFDFYLLHNLGEHRTKYFDDYDIWNFAFQRKEEGLIKHVGFSFHDKAAVLDEILTAHPEAEFVQLQINYADWDSPVIEARKCYEVACKHNKPIIIMEPVKGGTLATPPEQVANIFKSADPNASLSSWAIRFAASLGNVITVLSGVSDTAQMNDNLAYMKNFKPLTDEEYNVIHKANDTLATFDTVPCTACAYCMKDCPQSVAIFGSFECLNTYKLYNNLEFAAGKYFWCTDMHGWAKASACIGCGRCEEVCPQHIKIRDALKEAAEIFDK